jgi:hypothetical protein
MVARELELAGAGALGALLKRKARHAPEPGKPCPNCGADLQGFYCHICGQGADDHHRSILHLTWEGIEGLTHLDGRLGQTLPPLFINPGKLAKDHFEGRRQRHVPPFRLFLISLLIFMFVLESLFHAGLHKPDAGGHRNAEAILQQKLAAKTAEKTKAGASLTPAAPPAPAPPKTKGLHISFDTPQRPPSPVSVKVDGKEAATDGDGDEDDSKAVAAAVRGDHGGGRIEGWLKPRLSKAIENKDYYFMVLSTWAHRLAFLLLPILAALLALVYVRRRQYFIYDHLIVSMQFLSFVFLISAIAWILPEPVRGWAILAATLWVPINLYQTLRGAYGSRRWTAALKTVFLWVSTLFLFSFLMTGLMVLALAEME